MRMRIRRPALSQRTIVAAVLGLAGAAIVGVVALGGSDDSPKTAPHAAPIVVQDVSGRPTACLAADPAHSGVDAVWEAMRTSKPSTVNVQQLIVPVDSAERAAPYLAGMLSQHCDLIVTIGPAFGQAAATQAKDHPGVRFLAADAAGQTPDGVAEQVRALGRG